MNKHIIRIITINALVVLLGSLSWALPDLSINQANIIFTVSQPETNQPITIMAEIANNGDHYGSNVDPQALVSYTAHTPNAPYRVYENQWLAQYFVAPKTGYLGRVGVLISNQGDTTDMATLQIRNDDANSLFPKPVDGPSNFLISTTLTCDSSSESWRDFTFDIPILITEGQTYWLCMGNTSTLSNRYQWRMGEDTHPDMVSASTNQGITWLDVDATFNGRQVERLTGYHEIFETVRTPVSFYDGDPSSGGTLIQRIELSKPIRAGGQSTVICDWTPGTAGTHDIHIVIDEMDTIPESNPANNRAFKSISVVDNYPSIESVRPADGSIGIELDPTVSIIFSEPMDEASITDQTINVTAVLDNLGNPIDIPVTGSVAYLPASYEAVFTPASPLANNHEYRITIEPAIKDVYGHQISTQYSYSFLTVFNSSEENIHTGADGKTQVHIKPGSIGLDTFYIAITISPENTDVFTQATSKINQVRLPALSALIGTHRSFQIKDGTGVNASLENTTLTIPLTITIPYTKNSDGSLAGTSAPVPENSLALYWLNETDNLWVKVPGSRIDTLNNTVTAAVQQFGHVILIGEGNGSLANAYAYPVPYRPNDDPKHTAIKFIGLSATATIKIYTISGELVKTINESDGDGFNDTWNAQELASGMYIYRIDNGNDEKTGQLLIIK